MKYSHDFIAGYLQSVSDRVEIESGNPSQKVLKRLTQLRGLIVKNATKTIPTNSR